MNRRGLPFALLLSSAAAAATLDHATLTGAGETRGAFIERGAGARAAALGGAFSALADDPSALWSNPGGLGQLDAWRVTASYDLPGEGLGVSGAALAGPLLGGVAGVGLTVFTFGEVEGRDAAGDLTAAVSPTDLAVTAGWSTRNPGWLRLPGWTGAAVEMVREDGLGDPLLAVSAGGIVPLAAAWTAGWSVQHLGPGSDGFSLPAALHAGAAWKFRPWARLTAEAGLPFRGDASVAAGAEVSPHPALALRAGYRQNTGVTAPGAATGVAAGLGFRFGDLTLDYAIEPLAAIGAAHRVALSYRKPHGTAAGGQSGGPAPLAPGTRLNLAVSELTAQGVSASDAGVVADILRSELVKTGAFNVVEKKNMEKILAEQAFQQTGCTSEECAVKLGRILNAQRMVVGSFGKLMDSYFLSIRVVDIESGGVIAADSVEGRTIPDLKTAIQQLAGRVAKTAP